MGFFHFHSTIPVSSNSWHRFQSPHPLASLEQLHSSSATRTWYKLSCGPGRESNQKSRMIYCRKGDAACLRTVLAALPGPSAAKPLKRPRLKNKVLHMAKIGISLNDAAQAFFQSETRRRIFVTILMLMASRVGYFIPLSGYDRRLMPGNCWGFVLGTADKLGDLVSELKLSVFQLGISPYIFASIVMQLGCNTVPALIKIRKDGIDGSERLQRYVWWLSLGVAVVEAVFLAVHSAPYSIYVSKTKLEYMILTTLSLAAGAMLMHAVCEKTTEAGFGQGSSLIICVGILSGYSDSLFNVVNGFSRGNGRWGPQIILYVSVFLVMTVWAVLVTEGRRKVKLQYYNFELASTSGDFLYRSGLATAEVEPYVPFNINPGGMQPVLATTYLMALPGTIAALTKNSSWARLANVLNPVLPPAPGAQPWLFYTLSILFIFMFNVLDLSDTPKEIAKYMLKIGARIPKVKPGRQTIEHLNKVQASTRFWGGLLLGLLVTVSTVVDYKFRSLSCSGSVGIGFTSMLIIVGSIIELRRSFVAYNVMPALSTALGRYRV